MWTSQSVPVSFEVTLQDRPEVTLKFGRQHCHPHSLIDEEFLLNWLEGYLKLQVF